MGSVIMDRQREFFLKTSRIGFSIWNSEDTDLAKLLWCDEKVTKYICASGCFSEQEALERLTKEIQNQKEFGVQYGPIFDIHTGAFIGCCGLRPYDMESHIYEIGFHIRPQYWGQGIGSEAAKAIIDYAYTVIKAAGLFAGHHPQNAASAKMLARLGFRHTHDEFYEPTGLKHPSYRYMPLLQPRISETELEVKKMILETERLILREMTQADYPSLCSILQDEEVMYAYEGAFTDTEVQDWLNNQLRRYKEDGYGLWAVILKETEQMIGQCGLTIQNVREQKVLEIGYLFQKAFWHQGYAAEAAAGCREYAFEVLEAEQVYSIIRDTNIASQNVARRNGMEIVDQFVKDYRGVKMPHYVFAVKRNNQGEDDIIS